MYNKFEFCDRLKKAMKEKYYTQSRLSQETGISTTTINKYCQGIESPQKIENLSKLAKCLDVSVGYLIGDIKSVSLQDLQDIINNGELQKKHGLSIKLGHEQSQTRFGFMTTLHCTRDMMFGIYLTPEYHLMMQLAGGEYTVESEYHVINGNIYPKTSNELSISLLRNIHSIYDCINEGKDITPLKEKYGNERYSLGLLGNLSADEFYLLNYVLGYWEKSNTSQEN